MKKTLFIALLLMASVGTWAQQLSFSRLKFHEGDNPEWKKADFNDSNWNEVDVQGSANRNVIGKPDSYSWYRIKFVLPSAMLEKSTLKKVLQLYLGKIDDADETYLNGHFIGSTGRMPEQTGGYVGAWEEERRYEVGAQSPFVHWGKENVLAVRVYNGGGQGGMYGGPIILKVPDLLDGMGINFSEFKAKRGMMCQCRLDNAFKQQQKGVLTLTLFDPEGGAILATVTHKVALKGNTNKMYAMAYDTDRLLRMKAVYRDDATGKEAVRSYTPKYILTPKAPAAPRINSAERFGVRPESPVIYRIPASGERPMVFSVRNLPEGLALDAEHGIISGTLKAGGEYEMTLVAENSKGADERKFTICVGDKIALTPPMGWNSWNCWGLSVSQEKVMSSAQAMIDKGLTDYGYAYINVDDAWEAPQRNTDGTIAVNEKFPDMAGLGRWLHGNGLKFGIYSSPGDRTCGGYLGSLDHEELDARTYNSWGVDYLKYDWCGYSRVFDAEKDHSTAAYVRPYLKMERYLRLMPRDIFYSLCQYGMAKVWEWGHAVDANSWRTTGDITDTWESLYDIGFVQQAELYPYAGPGHWNDPDMLIVGKVGWSANLRDTRLTPDEQYTHISLWTLLSANMLIGCDISQIDDFTLNLLCNNEVNAINQDVLGKQARRVVVDGDIQIWAKPLNDGSHAVGIFNVGTDDRRVDFAKYFDEMGIKQLKTVRDLWRQKDLSSAQTTYFIPTHGVKYIKITY